MGLEHFFLCCNSSVTLFRRGVVGRAVPADQGVGGMRWARWQAGALIVLGWAAAASAAGLPEVGRVEGMAPAQRLVVAVIGDYGYCAYQCTHQQAVADLVHSWQPDVIVTTGDNSYDNGLATEVAGDQRPYAADVQAGRFLPIFGNHDWGNRCDPAGLQPSLQYFGMPPAYVAHLGNGLLDLFAVETTCQRLDRSGQPPEQALAYASSVAASRALWKVTAGHHPPYSSGRWGNNPDRAWVILPDIDLFLFGHDHDAEHIAWQGHQFVIAGHGGRNLTPLGQPVAGSLWGDDAVYGAVRLTVTPAELTVEFFAVGGSLQHSFTLRKDPITGKAYLAELTSPQPPWWARQAASTSLVTLWPVGDRYLAKLGRTGRVVPVPRRLVAQKHLPLLSTLLESAVAAGLPAEAWLARLPAELAPANASEHALLQQLYTQLLEMQASGQFGSLWARLLGQAQLLEWRTSP